MSQSFGLRKLSASAALAAGLLFVLELYFGRLLLPRLGGSAGVWTTCLCFFQAALLGGYLLAHGLQRLSARTQGFVFLALLGGGGLLLPIGLPSGWAPDPAQPLAGLLWALTRYLGLPFVALAAASPLLQSVTSRRGGRAQSVLAASNAGSLVGLLLYPLLLEPLFDLKAQAWGWALGYGVLCWVCLFAWRGGAEPPAEVGAAGGQERLAAATKEETPSGEEAPPATESEGARWLGWCVLAAVPAALLYAITTTLSTFFPPLPLLWVMPLALYLGGMSLAFARSRVAEPSRLLGLLLPLTAAGLLVSSYLLPALGRKPAWLLVALIGHLLGFGLLAYGLHRQLARSGPPAGAAPAQVTSYNLAIACGGLTGGLAAGVGAPLLLQGPVEYPLLLGLSLCLLPVGKGGRPRLFAAALTLPILLAGLRPSALGQTWPGLLAAGALTLAAGRAFGWGRLRVGAALLLVTGVAACRPGPAELRSARSLHGIHRVVSQDGFHHYLSSGVVHGRQSVEVALRDEPRAYFASQAPLGEVIGAWSRGHPKASIGAIGLGVGGVLPYAQAGQRWRFWELDPVVISIAEDPALFSYVARARKRGAKVELALGDGRLGLVAEGGGPRHDLLILDAFWGDAVPIHLLTQEAFDLYAERLAPEGVFVLNISTRYLDLTPLVAGEAQRLGWVGLQRRESNLDAEARQAGRSPSHSVILARSEAQLRDLVGAGWQPLPPPAERPWRDERASLVEVLGLLRSGR
jgi:hypothetical protein